MNGCSSNSTTVTGMDASMVADATHGEDVTSMMETSVSDSEVDSATTDGTTTDGDAAIVESGADGEGGSKVEEASTDGSSDGSSTDAGADH